MKFFKPFHSKMKTFFELYQSYRNVFSVRWNGHHVKYIYCVVDRYVLYLCIIITPLKAFNLPSMDKVYIAIQIKYNKHKHKTIV